MASTHSNGHHDPGHIEHAVYSAFGVAPQRIYEPETAQEMAELLAEARTERAAVLPAGGLTQISFGNRPSAVNWIASTGRLNRVLSHEPADLTMSVEAGVTLAQLQDALSEAQQHLPVESPDPERTTIGGLVATALVGPRRASSGTLRDYLIGISAAYPDGSVGKAGGLVVKNVSGFDLMRMHHGALGTLGVITSVNLKVMPAPRSEASLIARSRDLGDLQRAAVQIARLNPPPSALEVFRTGDEWTLACRWEGRSGTLPKRIEQTRTLLGVTASQLDERDSRQYWADYGWTWFRTPADGTKALVRVAGLPGDSFATLEQVDRISAERRVRLQFVSVSPRLGTVFAGVKSHLEVPAFQAWVRALRDVVPATTIIAAPLPWKADLDTWNHDPSALDLMRALKREFDPDSVINPGRYAGGI